MEAIQYPTKTKCRKECQCDFCYEKIEGGQFYKKSVWKESGVVYAYKTHEHCEWVAEKLRMYDETGSVDGESFQEDIRHAFSRIMSEFYNEVYESKDFEVPTFNEQLWVVIKHLRLAPNVESSINQIAPTDSGDKEQ